MILPRHGQLLSKVHKKVFVDSKVAFRSLQEGVVFWMEIKATYGILRSWKKIKLSSHVWKFLDFTKSFKVHINVNDFIINGVLIQDGHQIVFESKKFLEHNYDGQLMRSCISSCVAWKRGKAFYRCIKPRSLQTMSPWNILKPNQGPQWNNWNGMVP
jgi:hypothetical protein